jgi:large subunit ribosomal protein L21
MEAAIVYDRPSGGPGGALVSRRAPAETSPDSEEKAMYAVIRTGGKQYRVAKGDRLKVEKLAGDVGGKISFEVLLVGGEGAPRVGTPTVNGAAVEGEIVANAKHKKVIHFRKKKEGWTKKRGHRQPYTEVVITDVRA